jgi:hypothetical protein
MGAAEGAAAGFDPMADDLTAAVRARRGQSVDGAFETVKDVDFAA